MFPPVSKKYVFENVSNQATFLGNIRTVVDAAVCGADYGWTIDRFTSGNDGELLLHSNGRYGLQNLYYSLKLRNPNNGTSHLHICGQTGYSSGASYDAQPGRFTVTPRLSPSWDGEAQNVNPANFVTPNIYKQVIFVNKQFIMVFWEIDNFLQFSYSRYYRIWRRFFIGALDSLTPTTETLLNTMHEVCASTKGWSSSLFMGALAHYASGNSGYVDWSHSWNTNGLLWKQPYDSVAENKEEDVSAITNIPVTAKRWTSTLHYVDGLFNYRGGSGGDGNYLSTMANNYRIGGSYLDSTRYNVSVAKHFLHRPICYLYEYLNSVDIFFHPFAYIPYYGIRMDTMLSAGDIISYGQKNYAVYPTLRNGNTFGAALEFVED